MKKLLAVLLSLCLVVGMMPMMAFADDVEPDVLVEEPPVEEPTETNTEEPAEETTEQGKKTEKLTEEPPEEPETNTVISSEETLSAAIVAAQPGDTINLEADITLTSNLSLSNININGFKASGECYKLILNGNSVILAGGTVRLDNIDVSASGTAFVVKGADTVMMNNVDINANTGINVVRSSVVIYNTGTITANGYKIVAQPGVRAMVMASGYMEYTVDGYTYYTDEAQKMVAATVGDTEYATLEKALEEADGKDVHLVTDYFADNITVPHGVTLVIEEGVTLDVSGTLTVNGRVANYGALVCDDIDGVYMSPVRISSNVSGANITVWDDEGRELRFIDEAGTYWLFPGKYYVRATASGYNSTETSFTVGYHFESVYLRLDEHPEYRVYIASDIKHGDVSVDTRYAEEGDWVYITVDPDVGYRLYGLTVTRPSGNTVKVEHVRGNVFRFKMPGVRVTVDAEFIRTVTPFTDVHLSDWFYESVSYVYWNGLMEGVTSYEFAPNATTTRAMVVQILYRMAGSPRVTGGSPFGDVSAGAWYADAVIWAEANNIVNGVSATRFDPNAPVTREQLATMLYRYAQYRHYSTGANSSVLNGFADAGSVSDWAVSAMRWAVDRGIMDGTSSVRLTPQGQATRAQLAAMLMRFCTL